MKQKEYCKYILSKNNHLVSTPFYKDNENTYTKVEFYQLVNNILVTISESKFSKKGDFSEGYVFDILDKFVSKDFLFGKREIEDRLLRLFIKNRQRFDEVYSKWKIDKTKNIELLYDEIFEILSNILIIVSSIRISLVDKKAERIMYCSGPSDIDKDIAFLYDKIHNEEIMAKSIKIINWKRNKASYRLSFYYFSYMLFATYARNEELLEEWNLG